LLYLPEARINIVIPATGFKSGNLNYINHEFGTEIVIDGGKGYGLAEYALEIYEPGEYEIWSYYAANKERSIELYIDGNLINEKALGMISGGWTVNDLRWFREAKIYLEKGKHVFKLYTPDIIPHIHNFAFLKDVKGLLPEPKKYADELYGYSSVSNLFKDKIRTLGWKKTTVRLFKYILSGRLIVDYLDILGVYNGKYAFKGPHHVQIDLTNNCNNNCIACWCNSPLLEEKTVPPEVKMQTLPFDLVKRLLDELSDMGTWEIDISGGGEPFMHPQIMEILEYIGRKRFICSINTNFTLLDKQKITELTKLRLEFLTISTWAATPQTYALTHPNKSGADFEQIVENLNFLNSSKKRKPLVKLYNVIFNLNYHEIKEMLKLAKDTKSEYIEFAMIDTIPGKTDKLLLNPEQIRELQEMAQEISKCSDRNLYFDGIAMPAFGAFLRRISSVSDLTKATYDRNIIDKIPCYIGWTFARILANGDVNACLKAHRIPVGNLYQSSFKEIWNGERQIQFRKKTLVYEKRDPFFRLIGNDPNTDEAGCYKSCDDIGRNITTHNRIKSLTFPERLILKIVAKTRRPPL